MVKTLLLDCGGVLVKPATGDWVLSPGYEAVLGEAFAREHLDRFRRVRAQFLHLLPDTNVLTEDAQEHDMFLDYYARVFEAMDYAIPAEAIARLARLQVYQDARYVLFGDVLPYLDKWRGQYRLGIVSDAPPSTKRIMDTMGVTERIDAATYSYELGVLKPDAAIYRSTLDKLGEGTEGAVFVDDMPDKLAGAQALGIRCVQMRRPMPPLFPVSPPWDGPVVHDFAELDSLLRTL